MTCASFRIGFDLGFLLQLRFILSFRLSLLAFACCYRFRVKLSNIDFIVITVSLETKINLISLYFDFTLSSAERP